MKLYIQSAEYKRYNANNRGSNSPDCVKRAISMAFNVDYNQISKELNEEMKRRRYSVWNTPYVYEPVIYAHGGSKLHGTNIHPKTGEVLDQELYTVEDWIDTFASVGTYILETGPTVKHVAKKNGNHLTCCIDGTLFDSWDSSSQLVCGYYIVNSESSNIEFSNIQEHFDELRQFAGDLIESTAQSHIRKFIHDVERVDFDMNLFKKVKEDSVVPEYVTGRVDGYSLKFPCKLVVDGFGTKSNYSFTVVYVFKPTTTLEEAKKHIQEITKVRLYDRFYAIKKDLKEKQEAQDLQSDLTPEQRSAGSRMYLTPSEKRFYNSLPAWVRGRVRAIYVQSPGQYSDSYSIKFYALPGDPNREDVELEGYTSSMIKTELNMYKDDGYLRPHYDYSVYDLE